MARTNGEPAAHDPVPQNGSGKISVQDSVKEFDGGVLAVDHVNFEPARASSCPWSAPAAAASRRSYG